MTYALLDSAATTSLCADSLVSKLGLVDKTHAEIQTATAVVITVTRRLGV